jgi:hypothetical protein
LKRPAEKFDSDTERRFAIILERDGGTRNAETRRTAKDRPGNDSGLVKGSSTSGSVTPCAASSQTAV